MPRVRTLPSIARRQPRSVAVLWTLALVALLATPQLDAADRFGEYGGDSPVLFDGWNRHSVYVAMADGVELAVDNYLPTAGGAEATEPLPVVLHYTRYLRAVEDGGRTVTVVDERGSLQELLSRGYAVAVADARGSGASFGVRNGEFPAEETADAYELIEWLAAQIWCDGHVGMSGRSYPGTTQYLAATQAPPHLDAIFAEMASPSLYDFVYQGGTYKKDFIRQWGQLTKAMDRGRFLPPAPVDSDADGSRRDAAVAEHRGNLGAQKIAPRAKFRDSVVKRTWSWEIASSIDDAKRIQSSGVAVYHMVGWYDIFTTQQLTLFANLKSSPQKMMIGPWTHGGGGGAGVHRAELLRWYDYWLKGIDNGVMDEAPIHYYVMQGDNTLPLAAGRRESRDEEEAEDGSRWQSTSTWPPRAKSRKYYFAAGPTGSVASVNDGGLVGKRPKSVEAHDAFEVDYAATVGSLSRWMIGYDAERKDLPGTRFFDERTAEDERALTYTSAPLAKKLRVSGHPVAHVWAASTHGDGDLFVYLEEIDAEGRAHYVTEGALRASYRALAAAPWDNLGLPFHPSVKKELLGLGSEPVEWVFDLLATALDFDKGHRIRVTVVGAEAADFALYPDRRGRDAPTLSIYRDRSHSSYLELPIARSR
jgi:uncharacterized protein